MDCQFETVRTPVESKYWLDDWSLFVDRDADDEANVVLTFTILENQWIGAFESGGEKMVCLSQVLPLLDISRMSEIRRAMEQLRMALVHCSGRKLELLVNHAILPAQVRFTGLLSLSNAERLCKMFGISASSRPLSSSTDDASQYRVRVVHDCFGRQKGVWSPGLYTSAEAACIECLTCGQLLSPAQFVGHTHPEEEEECDPGLEMHWGFSSSNWRWHIRLADDPSRSTDEEHSLCAFLEEVKQRFPSSQTAATVAAAATSAYHSDPERCTPTTESGVSFNTSPSMPTPQSLSPTDSCCQKLTVELHHRTLQSTSPKMELLQQLHGYHGNFQEPQTTAALERNQQQRNFALINSIIHSSQDTPRNLLLRQELILALVSLLSATNAAPQPEQSQDKLSVVLEKPQRDTNCHKDNNNNSISPPRSSNQEPESWQSLMASVKSKTQQFKQLSKLRRTMISAEDATRSPKETKVEKETQPDLSGAHDNLDGSDLTDSSNTTEVTVITRLPSPGATK